MNTDLLTQLRDNLLTLHQELLQFEKMHYESVYGRIAHSGDFLGIVMNHPSFAWLKTLSEFIVLCDEFLDQKDSTKDITIEHIFTSAQNLLAPAEVGNEFAQKYFVAIQNEPSIALLHSKVKALFDQV